MSHAPKETPSPDLLLRVNGEPRRVPEGSTIEDLVGRLGLAERRVAVAVNRDVVPAPSSDAASSAGATGSRSWKRWEEVEPMADATNRTDPREAGPGAGAPAPDADGYALGSHRFRSRLIVGSGKYASFEQQLAATTASGAEMVTVALRRVDLAAPRSESLLGHLPEGITILPNTAGCYTVEDALTTARLGRELVGHALVKLEVIGDERTLFPDVAATLEAARILVDEGFEVLPYITDDPVACQRLAALGCAAVMPLAAPIGSGLGIRNPANLRIILETVEVPVVVDAGVGTASDAAAAMELGCTALLMNSAIAGAKEPVAMARAMRLAVEAGRLAYESGRIPRRLYASASSPLDGLAAF